MKTTCGGLMLSLEDANLARYCDREGSLDAWSCLIDMKPAGNKRGNKQTFPGSRGA